MENRNFTNLNINPCKMCMPMGAVTAFKGIENSMVILHGSQGCSTYIRRHMSEHYNEPVDIASSSLTEEGTVYGGEKNLKNGLKNIIKLYNPSIIGVATTCLAETIGEDIGRITEEFARENGIQQELIIPVHTPGYGGSQFEGYFHALRSIAEAVCRGSRSNGRINIIAGALSPADIRNVKRMLKCFEVEYTLLPDISDTLDSPYSRDYSKISEGGTRLEDIRNMPGAAATIEMGLTVPEAISPGRYLSDKYNVPLYRCTLPIGLRNTGAFLDLLARITGKPVPAELLKEKGRLLDGMIDSHKYNGEGRAVIFGEPELVLAVTGMCMENGIKPVVVSTGTENSRFKSLIEKECAGNPPVMLDDTDFETILSRAAGAEANILIGNSDGKVLTEKLGIPLVRTGYPIHDRVGGQRLVHSGYEGTMKLLDDITNTLLAEKHDKYRQKAFDRYYKTEGEGAANSELPVKQDKMDAGLAEKTASHPCFSGGACKNARMHIPVAPSCNISCNYCNRKYDCANESRPGVTSEILTPAEAAAKFSTVKAQLGNLRVVGIAGPGDALADFERTKASIKMIRELDPDITFCLSTNGLMAPHYADEIIELGVTHVTITINAVDPKIGALVYRQVNYMGRTLTGEEGAAVLVRNQLEGLEYLSAREVVCKVNIVMIKGVNDNHIEEVVKKVKEKGAYLANIMPLIPAVGSRFEDMQLTSNKELNEMRKQCEKHIRQMYHCRQCRADAIGTLDNDRSPEFRRDAVTTEPDDMPERSGGHVFAVASSTGRQVDQHFGHAKEFHIYRCSGSVIELLEKRDVEKYCGGADDCGEKESALEKSLRALADCDAVLVLRIGYHPMKALEEKGIKVIQTCGRLKDCLLAAAEELEKSSEVRPADHQVLPA